jgi:PPOX class probable F420-dependent enzyme
MTTHDPDESFLAEPNVAVLATADRRGRPHAVPVWYLYENGEFVISTGRFSRKHRNIEQNPHVTLVIDRRTLPYYAVMVYGTALVGEALTDEDRLRLAVRYLGDERGRAYVDRTSDENAVTLWLRVTKVVTYAGRAGRQGT